MRMTEEEYQKLIERRQGVTHKERTALQQVIEAANSKAKAPPEDQEQLALVNWLRMKGIRFHHSPNGGHRHKAVAGKLKAQGVSAGFPDLIIFPQIGSGRPLLFIELKRRKGGTISDSQKEWVYYLSELFVKDTQWMLKYAGALMMLESTLKARDTDIFFCHFCLWINLGKNCLKLC